MVSTPDSNTSDDPEALYQRGIEHLRRGSWQEATADFRQLIRINPGYGDASERLAEVKERARYFEDLQDRYHMGKAHLSRKEWASAIGYLKPIVDTGGKYGDAAALLAEAVEQLNLQTLYASAEVQLEGEKWEEAIATLEDIVNTDRTYRDSYDKLRWARSQCRLQSLHEQVLDHFREEEWPQAVRKLKAILRKAPGYRDANDKLKEARRQQKLAAPYSAGVGFQETRRWEDAINQFMEVIRLVRIYKIEGHKDVEIRLAEVRRQQRLDTLYRRSIAHLHRGELEEAVEGFTRVSGIDPNYRDVQAKLENCNKQLRIRKLCAQEEASVRDGNWSEAVKIPEELHGLVPEDTGVITRLEETKKQRELDELYRGAVDDIQNNRKRKARIALTEVIRRDPHYRDAAAQLGIARRHSAFIEALEKPLVQWIIATLIATVGLVFALIQILPSHTATPTPKPPTLCNGGFEKRNFECWEHGGELRQEIECEGSQCYVVLGDPRYKCEDGVPVGEAWIKQSFQVPQTISPTLSLRYRVFSYDVVSADFFEVVINGKPGGRFGNTEWHQSSCDGAAWDSGWQGREFDLSLYRGEMIEVYLRNVNRQPDKWWNTWTYVDDVVVR